MSQPVVHFEVIGKDPARLRKYFGELFGWEFDVPSPVAREVSEPDRYGFLDLVTSEDGTGIRGGVGGGPGYRPRCLLRRRPGCRGCLAARRRARGYTCHGSGHITDRPCRRSFHRPRRDSDWRRRGRMTAAPAVRGCRSAIETGPSRIHLSRPRPSRGRSGRQRLAGA